MKLPLQISLISPVVLKALCAVGLTCWCGYQQYQIYHLSAALAGTVTQDSIGSLIQRINSVEDRLDQSAKAPSVTMEDFRAGQQALSNRMDTLQTQIKKNQESTQAPSQSAASMLDIVALEAKFEGLFALNGTVATGRNRPILLKTVGFSNWKISRLIVSSEPVHHVAWLFASALIDAAWSMG